MREIRFGILVDWLQIIMLTLSAQRTSADMSPPLSEGAGEEESRVENMLDYLCLGGEVVPTNMDTDGGESSVSQKISYENFEAAIKKMNLVEEYWDDHSEPEPRDPAIGQMFDTLSQGQDNISRSRMAEVIRALNITTSISARALYGTEEVATANTNVTDNPTQLKDGGEKGGGGGRAKLQEAGVSRMESKVLVDTVASISIPTDFPDENSGGAEVVQEKLAGKSAVKEGEGGVGVTPVLSYKERLRLMQAQVAAENNGTKEKNRNKI